MKKANIYLQVDELILRGFSPGDRHRIGEAIQVELARLFAEQGMPLSLEQVRWAARLDGGAFTLSPDSNAEVIGTQVAQQIYGGLGQ